MKAINQVAMRLLTAAICLSIARTQTLDPVSVIISGPRGVTRPPNEIRVKVLYRNISDHPVMLNRIARGSIEGSAQPNPHNLSIATLYPSKHPAIDIRNESGLSVNLVSAKLSDGKQTVRVGWRSLREFILKPGETMDDILVLDTTRYDLRQPGSYKVLVQLSGLAGKSNEIVVEVGPTMEAWEIEQKKRVSEKQ